MSAFCKGQLVYRRPLLVYACPHRSIVAGAGVDGADVILPPSPRMHDVRGRRHNMGGRGPTRDNYGGL